MGFPLKQNDSALARIDGKGKVFGRFAGAGGGFGQGRLQV
jgi:hypothetical protein